MVISYNKLWKLLIDKNLNKTELRNSINMSSSTMAKLSKDQPVVMPVLERICAEFYMQRRVRKFSQVMILRWTEIELVLVH